MAQEKSRVHMAKPRPSVIVSQLEQLVQGVFSDVSNIDFPKQVLTGSPEYNAIRNAIARLRQQGKTGQALELARLLAATVPKDRNVKLQLARILWADRKFSEAADLLEETRPVGADHEWYSARAATFNSIGDYDSAFKLTARFRQAAPMAMTRRERVDLPLVAI
ncbi:MAG: tetratricopeptide repeat protein, partial [Pseudomonadota bacterium]